MQPKLSGKSRFVEILTIPKPAISAVCSALLSSNRDSMSTFIPDIRFLSSEGYFWLVVFDRIASYIV
jgi:hypothetical protein